MKQVGYDTGVIVKTRHADCDICNWVNYSDVQGKDYARLVGGQTSSDGTFAFRSYLSFLVPRAVPRIVHLDARWVILIGKASFHRSV